MTTEEKLKLAIEALKEIESPITAMRNRLKENERLDGGMAMHLSESANYLKGIATNALRKLN